jgi:dihydroorotase
VPNTACYDPGMIRRRFLQALTAAVVASGPAGSQPRRRRFDILIKNGEVCDPSRNFRQRADVAMADGKIAAIEENIPAELGLDVIDASTVFVVPGLVDLHTHCFFGGSSISVDADPVSARSGATTWVDAGSFSAGQVIGFRRLNVETSQTRLFGYVHLYPDLRNPDVDVVKYVRSGIKRTAEAVQANSDIVLGVKVYAGTNMNGRYSLDFMKIARELGDQFKVPLMVHVSFAPPEIHQVLELMRAGDILTHCNNGHTLGIVDSGYSETLGKLKPGVRDARDRGIIFDVGHGAGSFNFNAARTAIHNGFLPDCISTDLHQGCINGPTYDLPTTMSKYLYLGLSFEDVLLRSTYNPAKVIGRLPGMGTLNVGGPADVALLELQAGEFRLADCQNNVATVRQRIVSRLTISRGKRLSVPL